MSNVGSGIAGGAAAGAASGAGVGTAASPGIGTAIGAAIGAIGGAIAGGVKAKQDEKNREKEVKRVEEREDNAIRRATADALLSGIDPRSSGQVPNSAGSASVAPQETQEALSDLVQAGNQMSSTINQGKAIAEIKAQNARVNEMKAIEITSSSFSQYRDNADNMLLETSKAQDALSATFAERLGVTTEDLTKNLNQTYTKHSDAKRTIHQKSVDDGWGEFFNKAQSMSESEQKAYVSTVSKEWAGKIASEIAAKTGVSVSVLGPKIEGILEAKLSAELSARKSNTEQNSTSNSKTKGSQSSVGGDVKRNTSTMHSIIDDVFDETQTIVSDETVSGITSSSSSIHPNDRKEFVNQWNYYQSRKSYFDFARNLPYEDYVSMFLNPLKGYMNQFTDPDYEHSLFRDAYINTGAYDIFKDDFDDRDKIGLDKLGMRDSEGGPDAYYHSPNNWLRKHKYGEERKKQDGLYFKKIEDRVKQSFKH